MTGASAPGADPRCPLCLSAAPKRETGRHEGYRMLDCPDCGAGFADPFENPGPEYYEHDADLYPVFVAETTDRLSGEYDAALGALRPALPRGAALLDVGCGAGGFLHRTRREGWSPMGLDFNAKRSSLLKERGFDVWVGSLLDFARADPSRRFAAVTMFEIIEHLDDPAGWLAAVRHLLGPDGLLVVGTPNRRRTFDHFNAPGMDKIDLPPHHLTRWTAETLSRFLARCGFEVVSCGPVGYPLPLFQLMLRNTLRLGLATKALQAEQVRHVEEGRSTAAPAGRARLVTALVAVKSAAIDLLALLLYPLFLLTFKALRWEGPILVAVAKRPS